MKFLPTKPLYRMLVIVAVVIALLAAKKFYTIYKAISQHSSFQPPPEAVTSFIAKEEIWQPTISVVGTLQPVQGVTLAAEEVGKVIKVNFESGASVKKGDLLVQLDTAVEEGNLKSAVARMDLAKLELGRAQNLRARNVNSESDLNNAQAMFRQAEGEVSALKGQIQRKTIIAPFDGEAGIRKVNVGQMVLPGAEIVPVHNLSELYLDFSVPQQDLQNIYQEQEITFTVDAYPSKKFKGKVSAINPQVDDATRNVMVQAIVANPEKILRSGMFASIEVSLREKNPVIIVPATAINYAPYGDSVYVIENLKDPTGKEYLGVRQQIVEVGPTKGELVSILKGLKAGEQVVTSGLFKLRPNAAVVINNSIQPGSSQEPNPQDT